MALPRAPGRVDFHKVDVMRGELSPASSTEPPAAAEGSTFAGLRPRDGARDFSDSAPPAVLVVCLRNIAESRTRFPHLLDYSSWGGARQPAVENPRVNFRNTWKGGDDSTTT